MNRISRILIVLLFLLSHFAHSQNETDSQKHALLEDRFIFTGGLFFPKKELKLSVDGSIDPRRLETYSNDRLENEIDFGDAFDVARYQATYNMGFQWRFSKNKRWKLVADYFGVYDRWDATLDEKIEWEDVVYEVGADVRAGFDLGVLRSAVGYSLSRGDQHELGVALGAHIMTLAVFIEGQAEIKNEDGSVGTDFHRGAVDATAPLPNIGGWYYWAPASRWLLTADVDWLYIAFGEYQGGLWDIKGGVQYQVVDWFGVGANYRYYGINLEVDKTNWNGELVLSYSGPMVMVNFNF